jgi:hypothetical protein
MSTPISPSIFKAYDIRGIVDGDPANSSEETKARRPLAAAVGLALWLRPRLAARSSLQKPMTKEGQESRS